MPQKGIPGYHHSDQGNQEVSGDRAHLSFYAASCEIKPCTFWISWRRVHHIADLIRNGAIDSRGEWRRLHRVCTEISTPKRHFLYDVCKAAGLSDGAITYLFGGWAPTPRKVSA